VDLTYTSQQAVDSNIYNLYLPKFNDDQYLNDLFDTSLITQISATPDYSNIKNDWICWGSRQSDSTKSDAAQVRYHLAIDKRPHIPKNALGVEDPLLSLCCKDIYAVYNDETEEIIRYSTTATVNAGEHATLYTAALNTVFSTLGAAYWFDWKEELYRQALIAYGSSTRASYYDEELMAEWRYLFDPESTIANKGNDSFEHYWTMHFGSALPWSGYNVDILIAPETIRYWLDLIDAEQSLLPN